MKNTIPDYIDFRGDLSMIDHPYNEIDYLILSEFSYIDFSDFIDLTYQHIYTIHELFQLCQQNNIKMNDDCYQLFLRMEKAIRYQNIKVICYVDDVNAELVKQFSAMALLLEDQSIVIAYRGTDDSLIGWHEDFLMLCENVVPAQSSSVKFLEYVATYPYQSTLIESLKNKYLAKNWWQRFKKHFLYQKKKPLILTGHSKGGNLAMYAGCFCKEELKERIQHIYNYDGPGFQEQVILSAEYKKMLPKIDSYIPHYSFFGIVLGHDEAYHVVCSHYSGMLQHNGFSWEVGREHFIEDELSYESVQFAIKVIVFLEKLSLEDKYQLVDAMFSLFDSLNLYTFSDLSHISYKHILNAIKELTLLDSKVRKTLIEVLQMLWVESTKAKKE